MCLVFFFMLSFDSNFLLLVHLVLNELAVKLKMLSFGFSSQILKATLLTLEFQNQSRIP